MSEEKSQAANATGQAVESVSLLDQLVEATRVKPGDEAYAVTRSEEHTSELQSQ